jgi:hypothetical protein
VPTFTNELVRKACIGWTTNRSWLHDAMPACAAKLLCNTIVCQAPRPYSKKTFFVVSNAHGRVDVNVAANCMVDVNWPTNPTAQQLTSLSQTLHLHRADGVAGPGMRLERQELRPVTSVTTVSATPIRWKKH